MPKRQTWVGEAGVIAGLAVLVAAKMWTLITPLSQFRASLGGDFGLAVEAYFYHMLKSGTIPLWDPTLGTGSPFLGGGTHHPMFLQAHLHLFYPLNVLWLGLAERKQFIPHALLQYHHAFHYLLAGVFTYAYGRQLGLARFPASLAGIAFMFSGFLLAHVQHWTMVDTIVWLPLVLACVVRADATGQRRWGVLAGLGLGIAFLAGHPQIFYYMALVAAALGLTLLGRRVMARQPWARLATVYLLVPAVALGIAAVQLLPSWEAALGSHRAGLDYGWKAIGSYRPAFLLQLVLPWGLLPVEGWQASTSEFYLYPGILPLVLAGYAVARRWDWRVGFHAAVALGAVLLAFGDNYGAFRLAYELIPGLGLFRIPARILGLVSFALAVLAGLGAQTLLGESGSPGLTRFLRAALAIAGIGAVAVHLLLVRSQAPPASDLAQRLADQYVMLALLLAGTLLVVSWRPRASPALVRAGLLVILLVDLLFGSFSLGSAASNPDHRPPAEPEWLAVLRQEREPIRLSRGRRIHPRLIYEHGWGIVDGESTFAPPAFLDLYGLIEANPRIFDLLNVKYVVTGSSRELRVPRAKFGRLALWPDALRRVALPAPTAARTLELDSHLVYGAGVPQGAPVAVVHAVFEDGSTERLTLRAGVETAEWALDRPGSAARHGRPPAIARSWTVGDEGFRGHTYRATLPLRPAGRLTELIVEHAGTDAVLVVEALRLDGRDPPPPPDRLEPVVPGLYRNRYALPRAFLVRRARQVPPERILDALRDLDPAEEALVTDPLPTGWPTPGRPTGPPLPAVRIVDYLPERVRLETEVAEPLILVLGDTYDARWRAWDNGRPVPILRADHALRAVPLQPGRHVVEFRYRQPSFWVGLALSLGTIGAVVTGGLVAGRRRGKRAP